MSDAAQGFRIRNSTYRAVVKASEGEEITEQTASRDLKALVDSGLLLAVGEKRARIYRSGEQLRQVWTDMRRQRPHREADDPFATDFQPFDPAQQRLARE